MVKGIMTELRSKFRIIFESYFDFAKKELTTGQYASYSLSQSCCRFSVTFKRRVCGCGKILRTLKKCLYCL